MAAVAAVDAATAQRALDLIRVEYELLAAVDDPFEALQPGAPRIHDELDIEGNVSMEWNFQTGDLAEAERRSAAIVSGSYSSPQAAPAPIETHVVIAGFDADGDLEVISPVHMVFMYRKELADCLGLDWRRITVKQPPVGGSFGGKIDIDAHDFIAVMLAGAARRPVKLAMSREEEFTGTRTRQPIHFRLRTGADADGTLLFRHAEVVSDNGAYNAWGSHALLVAMNTVTSMYRVGTSRLAAKVVYTNKNYGGSVRGFGNPQATFAVEQQMEELADALGMDPMDLRLRNANRPGDVTPQGLEITSCGLSECLETVRRKSGWDQRRGRMRSQHRGLGAAAYVHVGGGARIYGSDGCGAMIKIDDSGRVALISGSSELGQGSETALAMIVAEMLGVPLEAVSVSHDDTDVKPWDVGVHASRTTFVAGNAARMAAAKARDELLEGAAEVLDRPAESLTIRDGVISVPGEPGASLRYEKAVRRRLLREGSSIIMTSAFYDPPTQRQDENYIGNISASYGFGAHVAEVEVDPDTGMVRVRGLWAAHDVGRAINPMSCEGQIEGGAVMGVGLALSEELPVEDGRFPAPNLHDYGMPTAVDAPPIDVTLIETADELGPFGAKGIGEGGIILPPAAIANAWPTRWGCGPGPIRSGPGSCAGGSRPASAPMWRSARSPCRTRTRGDQLLPAGVGERGRDDSGRQSGRDGHRGRHRPGDRPPARAGRPPGAAGGRDRDRRTPGCALGRRRPVHRRGRHHQCDRVRPGGRRPSLGSGGGGQGPRLGADPQHGHAGREPLQCLTGRRDGAAADRPRRRRRVSRAPTASAGRLSPTSPPGPGPRS